MARKRRRKSTTAKKKRTLSAEQLEKMRLGRERAAERRRLAAEAQTREKELDGRSMPHEMPRDKYGRMLDSVRRTH